MSLSKKFRFGGMVFHFAPITALLAHALLVAAPKALPYDLSADPGLKIEKALAREDAALEKVFTLSGDGYLATLAAPVPTGDFTVEARLRPLKNPKSGDYVILGSQGCWQLLLYAYPDGKAKVVFMSWVGKKTHTVKTAQLLNYEQWHHIAAVVEGNPRKVSIWVDGKALEGTQYEMREETPGELDAPTRPFVLGARLRGELAGVTVKEGATPGSEIKTAAAKLAAVFPSDPEPPVSLAATAPSPNIPGQKLRVFLMGDSTVASYPEAQFPLMGWGQVLGRFFNPEVRVANHAIGGRSTKSFLDEKRFDAVLAALSAGDYVFIQFGHNDAKKDRPELYAAPDGAYRDNLRLFVAAIREKGAHPILVTSVARRIFTPDGKIFNSHGAYPEAMKAVALETKTPLIDLAEKSMALLQSQGPEGAKKLYNYSEAGQYPGWPKGNKDDSHFCEGGAVEMATLITREIRDQKLPLSPYLK